ncbi:uncharacterized protein L3040_001719 [Drepanopeziza brunnea f. sp. 'multigermtubi']|uniref:uncharacterized protein n=1 Tax=Drepanopeziza brunnea f. sp. 'multigermtubi' TaxID=698441 RepID=UPI00239E899E|nr:hypothetical protein L3040_001719 [Drepanopeziza brunnea f. sp. 'multigermtubi']
MPKFSLAFSSPHSQSCSDGSKNETGLMKPTVCLHIQNLDNRLEDDEKNQHAGRLKNRVPEQQAAALLLFLQTAAQPSGPY